MLFNNLASLQLLYSRQKALQHPQLASKYSNTSILKNSITHVLCCPFHVVHDETAEKLNERKLSLATNLSEVLQYQCFQSVIIAQILEVGASCYSTSHEPPIVSTSSFRLFVVVLVALCHCRSSDPELALWSIVRSEVASFGRVDELFFNVCGYVAMRVHRPGKRIVYGAHACCLSEAVSCDNWGECHEHENLRVLGERSATIHTKAKIASCCSANGAEDHAIGDSATGKACRQQGFLCG
jgi:hypothetical protein